MRTLLAPAAVAALCLTVLLAALPSLASPDGGGAGVSGTFPANLNVQSDICQHDQFIWGAPPPHNRLLQVVVDPGQPGAPDRITISGPSPFVTVQGFMEGANFSATGTGQVGPNPQASVELTGTWNGSLLTGNYTMGSGPSDLPPCGQPPTHHAAVYTIKPKPSVTPTRTPTRTPTPAEKLYSIIVLKQHADTYQPLPGWQFNLFETSHCQGLPFVSGTTDANGMVDFTGLQPGTYSVQEKLQAGWNPVGDVCQDVVVGTAGSPAGLPPCPIQPDQDHPQPGCDTFFSGARVVVRINATGEESAVNLNGPTLIRRNNKPSDKDGDGLDEINTEIVAMELTGGGITVRESATRASIGLIEEQANSSPGVLNFPANSFFDVFFEVDIGGVTLHNETPFRLACKIEQIPPYLCFYVPPIREPILLFNAQGVKIATLLHGKHIPLPPNEALVIFTNRPKVTPTRTPTGAATPTRTPTPTNPPPNGECTKTGQDVPFQGGVWDLWKCRTVNIVPLEFNRVDIAIGKATQDMKLRAAHFVCQDTEEKVAGVFKTHKKNAEPGTNLPHHEVWSGAFVQKCLAGPVPPLMSGVNVYLQTLDPANHASIASVAFTNTSPPSAPTPTRTRTPTPTPAKPLGDVNDDGLVDSRDALLILQRNAGLLAALPNPASADVDDDGDTDSIDALIVLQVDAGLLELPGMMTGQGGGRPLPSLPLW